MSKSKNDNKIATVKLLKSKALNGYQIDFAKAILTKSEYTIKEAMAALDEALPKGEK